MKKKIAGARSPQSPSHVFILKLCSALFLSTALFILFSQKPVLPQKSVGGLLSHSISVRSVHAATASANLEITPTSTPSATPVPNYGFCLYVPVLYYHHVQSQAEAVQKYQTNLSVDNGIFDGQMAYLASHGYTTITAKQLVEALRNHTQLPQKSIVVTLDDGYSDMYTYAYPIFQKYHINATLFIATGLLEGSDYLSWSHLIEMQHSGLIYIVDHTWSHFSLPKGPVDKMSFEIDTARDQIQQRTGQTVDIFGYPYGSFNEAAIALLQQHGFLGAYSTIPGMYQCDSFIMALHRTRIGNAPLSSYGL